MPALSADTLLILAGFGGFLLGVVVMAIWARWALRRARLDGRSSRDAEVVALAGQRAALEDRCEQLTVRLERSEVAHHEVEAILREESARAAAEAAQARQFHGELEQARRMRDEATARLVELTRRHAALEAGTAAEAHAAAEKLVLMEQAEQRLRDAFAQLASGILDDKAARFREQSAEQLGGLIDPLKLQLKEFRETLNQTHASEQRERGMLAKEIQTLRELNLRIGEDALNLTRALKGDARAQGAWGEMVLERILEASGLSAGREFEVQRVQQGDDGGRPRPDVIVHLPDQKDLVIDAKVSLVAWERWNAATDDATRDAQMREHVASLRRHIDGLAKREYASLPGLRSLDFVLLFVPIEPAFVEALRADDGLYDHALQRNIALVSPGTLLATLRTVAHLWKMEDRNLNASEIARQAGALYDGFAMLEQELGQVHDALEKALRTHEGAMRRIRTGRGNLLGRVEKLRKLGADAKKRLPQSADDDTDDRASDGLEITSPLRLAADESPGTGE